MNKSPCRPATTDSGGRTPHTASAPCLAAVRGTAAGRPGARHAPEPGPDASASACRTAPDPPDTAAVDYPEPVHPTAPRGPTAATTGTSDRTSPQPTSNSRPDDKCGPTSRLQSVPNTADLTPAVPQHSIACRGILSSMIGSQTAIINHRSRPPKSAKKDQTQTLKPPPIPPFHRKRELLLVHEFHRDFLWNLFHVLTNRCTEVLTYMN